MNKCKAMYRENILKYIADEYVYLENEIDASQGCMEQNTLDQKWGTLKYLKNLLKNISSETPEEIEERLDEARAKMYKERREK